MWFQLKIEHCATPDIEKFSEQLEELGAVSITLSDKNDNPVLEPEPGTTPLWPEVNIEALFTDAISAQAAREQLQQENDRLTFHLEIIEDRDWERVWMDEFKPQRFGERLWICPSWSTPPEPHAVNLMLDPGLAFGTGTHPTTALCLTWLEKNLLAYKEVIDYGCGSGILSLAALKLGALSVSAVDIDEQALIATQNNAAANQIEAQTLQVGFPETLNQPVDLIVANILLAPLMSLTERFSQLLKSKGLLVVSGLLTEQANLLSQTYETHFTILEHQTLGDWSLLVFQRKS